MGKDKTKKLKVLGKLQRQNEELKSTLHRYPKMSESERKIQIRNLLHKYNEMKDAAQMMVDGLANVEGLTIKRMHEILQLPLE